MSELKKIIEQAFENRNQINTQTKGEIRNSVDETLDQLDNGLIRVCEKNGDDWIVNQWIKKAILLSCLLYTSPSPRDATLSRMPSSA